MVIDGHAHACGAFLTGESILKTLDDTGVDKVVLVPGELGSERTYALPNLAKAFPEYDVVRLTNALTKVAISLTGRAAGIPEGNRRVYALARMYPERIIQFFWVLLQKPDTIQEMEDRFAEWKFRGIKLHQCWDSFSIGSKLFDWVARFAAERELPIFIHVGDYREVAALIDYSRQHPDTTFIVGHLFGLELYMQSKHDLRNVYFEISAPPLISLCRLSKALQHFGASRLILGSDVPYGRDSLRLNVERVKALPIPDSEQEMILGRNLQTLLKLA